MITWYDWAHKEIGTREDPGNKGAAIRRYVNLAHCGAEGEPWCAIFANAALESSGIRGTRSAYSLSFLDDPNFVKLSGPALGAITIFKRSGGGHVGFYSGETTNSIYVLGGNEGDMVQIEPLPRNAPGFRFVGYRWPKSVPLPEIKPIIMPPGTPRTTVT